MNRVYRQKQFFSRWRFRSLERCGADLWTTHSENCNLLAFCMLSFSWWRGGSQHKRLRCSSIRNLRHLTSLLTQCDQSHHPSKAELSNMVLPWILASSFLKYILGFLLSFLTLLNRWKKKKLKKAGAFGLISNPGDNGLFQQSGHNTSLSANTPAKVPAEGCHYLLI